MQIEKPDDQKRIRKLSNTSRYNYRAPGPAQCAQAIKKETKKLNCFKTIGPLPQAPFLFLLETHFCGEKLAMSGSKYKDLPPCGDRRGGEIQSGGETLASPPRGKVL